MVWVRHFGIRNEVDFSLFVMSICLASFVLGGNTLLEASVGEFSLTAYATVLVVGISLAGVIPCVFRRSRRRLCLVSFPSLLSYPRVVVIAWFSFGIFSLVALARSIASGVNPRDFQPAIMVTLFLLVVSLSLVADFRLLRRLLFLFSMSGTLGAVLVLVDLALSMGVFSSRHFAMVLLMPLVFSLSQERYWWLWILSSLIIFGAILESGSRTASLVAFSLMLMGSLFNQSFSLGKRVSLLLISVMVAGQSLAPGRPLNQRALVEVGDAAVIQELPNSPVVNTNGRYEVWNALLSEVQSETFFWGLGPGFSREFLAETFNWTHPHNEYIRVLLDFGVVSLGVLVFWTLVNLGFFLFAGTKRIQGSFLGLGSVAVIAVMSLTDLPWVSLAVVFPLALGLAAAFRSAEKVLGSKR